MVTEISNSNSNLIILDRDGVINYESHEYIKSPDEWIPLPKSLEAIALLTKANFKMVIATNQSGIARGLFTFAMLEAIHQKMLAEINRAGGKIEKIFICPHGPWEACTCRKPKPGLLEQIAHEYQVNLTKIPFVGDSLRDIEAAEQVGCTPILVKTGNGEEVAKTLEAKNLKIYEDLWAFANDIISS